MPELPEIETVKLQLQKVLIGQKLLKSNFSEINNKKVTSIDRKGKMLLINFGEGLDLGFHFKMTGQLIYDDGKKRIAGGHPSEDFVAKLPNKHTREVFEFEQGKLFFNDMRKFGWVKINPKFGESLGPEPISMNSDQVNKVIKLIKRLRRPIKTIIMDQEIISGVGNIYANDGLWESKIHPSTPVNKLQVKQLRSLFGKIKLVLREGIKYGGATSSNYVDLHGLGGHYQDHFRVYKREKLPCLVCKTSIRKFVLGGRGTYFCPACQS